MNFQSLNPNTYTDMFGTIISASPTQQGKYGLEANCVIADDNNNQQQVLFSMGRYNAPLPQQQHARQRIQISAKCVNGKYYAFWKTSQNQQVNQAPAQNPQQAAFIAPQSTNQPSPIPQGQENGKHASICRQTAGKVVAEVMGGFPLEFIHDLTDLPKAIIDIAEPIAEWFLTGQKPPLNIPEGQDDTPPF